MQEPSKEIRRWADAQQYVREPIPESGRRKIVVTLANATPDPLGELVALNGIYKGEIIRSHNHPSMTDEARRQAFDDLTKTALSGPLEAIQFRFLIEGVTRSITHQMVRSRFSFFAQESLRFAVPEGDWIEEVPLPPWLKGTKGDQPLGAERDTLEYQRNVWDEALRNAQQAYLHLVNSGMPAEEARDLLPHAMPTRIWWVMDLRTLLLEAGKRTCTQAQFPWREIFAGIAKALREYGDQFDNGEDGGSDGWQLRLIADKIRPHCYQTGSCGFMAQFDRGCTIRERVEANASIGRPSSEWDKTYDPEGGYLDGPPRQGQIGGPPFIRAIDNREWAADPGAARI